MSAGFICHIRLWFIPIGYRGVDHRSGESDWAFDWHPHQLDRVRWTPLGFLWVPVLGFRGMLGFVGRWDYGHFLHPHHPRYCSRAFLPEQYCMATLTLFTDRALDRVELAGIAKSMPMVMPELAGAAIRSSRRIGEHVVYFIDFHRLS